jgi:hypothetical protein
MILGRKGSKSITQKQDKHLSPTKFKVNLEKVGQSNCGGLDNGLSFCEVIKMKGNYLKDIT